MNFLNKNTTLIYTLMFFLILVLTLLDFGLNFFTNDKLKKFINTRINSEKTVKISSSKFTSNMEDKKWAKKILNGGYIIYIRHAKRRSDFPSTGIFDLLEAEIHENGINGTRYAENDYFATAVCLTEDGKIQAKGIGELFKEVSFPIGKIFTSPSCRARQTAEIMFGYYDKIDHNLLHTGVYSETKKMRFNDLRDFFSSIDIEDNKNTIITAHGSVIMPGLFENPNKRNLRIDQAGMIVLSKNNNNFKIEHTFKKFDLFIRALYER